MEIEVKTLTTCEVERDGEALQLSFIDATWQAYAPCWRRASTRRCRGRTCTAGSIAW
jgi:hypothetical protein